MRRTLVGVFLVALSAVPCRAHAQGNTPALPKGTNTVFGQLVDIRDDSPVGGAIVTLTGYAGDAGKVSAQAPSTPSAPSFTPLSVMTNGDGRFFFRDLPPGRYAIASSAQGYLANMYPQHFVDVADGERPTPMTLRLWKAGSVSGSITDERAEPVVGIRVTAFRRDVERGRLTLVYTGHAATDDRGSYRIGNLPPGRYVIAAMSASTSVPVGIGARFDEAGTDALAQFKVRSSLIPGGAYSTGGNPGLRRGEVVLHRPGPPPPLSPEGVPLVYQSTFYPGTTRSDAATEVAIVSGDSPVGLDFAVRYEPTVVVSGTLTGPEGPASNVFVRLAPAGADIDEELDRADVEGAVTDAAGRFVFAALPAGEYELSAQLRVGPETDFSFLWTKQSIAVPAEGLRGLSLTLQPSVVVTGRMEFKQADGSNTPLPERAWVGLRPVGATSWSSGRGEVGADNTFTARTGMTGAYEIYAVPSGPPWTWSSTSQGNKPLPDSVITLTERGARDIVVTMTDVAASVSGTVTNAQGAADAASDVILFPADTSIWRQGIFHDRRVRMIHVSSNGAFSVSALPAGDYYLAAIPQHAAVDWRTTSFLERLIPGATTVTLRDGETRTLTLKTLAPRER